MAQSEKKVDRLAKSLVAASWSRDKWGVWSKAGCDQTTLHVEEAAELERDIKIGACLERLASVEARVAGILEALTAPKPSRRPAGVAGG